MLRGGDVKYIVPATNPSVACRLCDQPFARIDKAIRAVGQEALDVFKSMQAVGQEPNVISYDSLITACAPSCEHGNQGFADEWLFEEGCRTE